MDQSEIVQRAQDRHPEGFEELVITYSLVVQRFAYQIGVKPEDVEDVTQEVFIKVYRSLSSFSGGTFTTWLYSVTLNTARDMMRRHQRHKLKLNKMKEDHSQPSFTRLNVSEEAMELHDLIQEISEKYRVPIVLHYFHQMTFQEISAVTGTTESGVKSQVMRAREQLKAKLEKGSASS